MKYHFFWRTASPFSQWHPSYFMAEDAQYCCAEQYMMRHKALVFKDYETAEKIMDTDNPAEQKKLGREVKNYNDEVWKIVAPTVVFYGNLAKFTQNEHLKKKLLETGDLILVEASPYDTIWGVGLSEDDPRILDEKKWRGQNLLGKVLMAVRGYIREC